jgi:hypothetical protein
MGGVDPAKPLFLIEVPVPSQESEHSCICVRGSSVFEIFWLYFGIVSV